jgi:hypothetical protein
MFFNIYKAPPSSSLQSEGRIKAKKIKMQNLEPSLSQNRIKSGIQRLEALIDQLSTSQEKNTQNLNVFNAFLSKIKSAISQLNTCQEKNTQNLNVFSALLSKMKSATFKPYTEEKLGALTLCLERAQNSGVQDQTVILAALYISSKMRTHIIKKIQLSLKNILNPDEFALYQKNPQECMKLIMSEPLDDLSVEDKLYIMTEMVKKIKPCERLQYAEKIQTINDSKIQELEKALALEEVPIAPSISFSLHSGS